jgi:D-xylulose reductase
VKEAPIETVFRCANIHARAIELIAPGNLKPLISGTFPFEQSIEVFERAGWPVLAT